MTRRRGDTEQTGRVISPLAYAWYARGSHHEKKGDVERARLDYQAALDHDPQSGAAWAALGRLLCAQGDKTADRVFQRGLQKSERKAPLLFERGVCLQKRAGKDAKKLRAACVELEQAVHLEPHSRRFSEGFEQCLLASGRPQEAERHRRATRLFLGEAAPEALPPSLRQVDDAIVRGDLKLAQTLALELITPGALSARAALWGKRELAQEQAELVLAAAPDDADAWVTLLSVTAAAAPSPSAPQPTLSREGVVLLALLLKRRAGEKAALHFLQPFRSELAGSGDELIQATLRSFDDAPRARSAR